MSSKQIDLKTLRAKLGLNQSEFWSRIGVTQSGGSRYETDRRVPQPVRQLLRLQYELGIDLSKINSENAPVIRALLNGKLDQKAVIRDLTVAQALVNRLTGIAGHASQLTTV